METINIVRNDAGQRLDSFLKKIMPCAPAGLLYKYIRTNKLKLNSKKPKPDVRLCEGDIITYYGDSSLIVQKKFTPKPYTLDAVYEDDNILVLNKPPLMACQPDSLHKDNTLVDNVKSYLYEKGAYSPRDEHSFAPALCNRIDFNTSGLCIAAKNAESLRIINAKLKKREIRRFYICVTQGIPNPEIGIIKNRVKKDAAENKSSIVKNGGKEAETHYRVLRTKGSEALVETEIISGRTHQIRLHMSSLGCPVKGDPKYGHGGGGQFLTANKITFAFKSDAGVLSYLKDKEISVKANFDF